MQCECLSKASGVYLKGERQVLSSEKPNRRNRIPIGIWKQIEHRNDAMVTYHTPMKSTLACSLEKVSLKRAAIKALFGFAYSLYAL